MNCPTCGKAMRKDNRRGHCSACLSSGRTPAAETPALKTQRRFREVARALGVDPAELDRQFRDAWLESLKNRSQQ